MPNDAEVIYENRVVLFMDILGFKDLVSSKGREVEILDALTIPKELSAKYPFNGKTAMELTAFSDSVVVSEPVESDFNVERMVHYASYLQLKFLAKGVLTRGGIAVGEMHHKNGIAFGPALVEAYKLETELAHYPRIVIPPAVEHVAMQSVLRARKQFAHAFVGILRKDVDGVMHVNSLGPLGGPLPYEEVLPDLPRPTPGQHGVSITPEQSMRARTELVRRAMANRPTNNPRAAAKYDWLQHYFNSAWANSA